MKLFQIPDEVRVEEYEEGGETYDGDGMRCGGCNWQVNRVWMMADDLAGAINEFKENHRGLCGDCMCELLGEMCERGSEIMKAP